MERVRNAGQDMPPPKQGGAEGHEVRDTVVAIADQLVQDTSDKGEGLGVVEAHTARQTLLRLEADLADDELVELDEATVSIDVVVRV